MKKDDTPECLRRLYDIAKALEEVDSMLDSMRKIPGNTVASQIQYLEDQIKDLEKQQEELIPEAERIIETIRYKSNKAYLAIKFHYFYGWNWEKTADLLGIVEDDSRDVIRQRAYRAIRKYCNEKRQ